MKRNEIYYIIWANIRKIQYLEEMSNSTLADILEVSERTLYTYDAEPEKLTLERIQLFMKKEKITIEKLIEI